MRRQLNGQMFVWLHVFACAARHLSFTRCAEELHITPGAVSQQMRQLEERLGYRLFLRRARGVELSAEGQRLAQTVAEAYGSIEAELLRLDAGKSAAHCVCVRSRRSWPNGSRRACRVFNNVTRTSSCAWWLRTVPRR